MIFALVGYDNCFSQTKKNPAGTLVAQDLIVDKKGIYKDMVQNLSQTYHKIYSDSINKKILITTR